MIGCKYCREYEKYTSGEIIRTDDFKKTQNYKEPEKYRDWLEMFILKCIDKEKAGLMIGTLCGYRYVEIDYCPWCGRKF